MLLERCIPVFLGLQALEGVVWQRAHRWDACGVSRASPGANDQRRL